MLVRPQTRFFCPYSKQAAYTPRRAVPDLPHVNSHARPSQLQATLCRHTGLSTDAAAARGLRVPNPGHGHRHLPHLAAGLRLGDYATQPEDCSACFLNQEDPFE